METTNLTNLAKAVVAVMKEVKNIDKNTTVGSGSMAYKGVSDKDVKLVIGEAMANNGLCILPIDVDPETTIHRWEEEKIWNGQSQGVKQKQSVFTEVKTKYLLLHESGESAVLSGHGHGNDAMDKSAGKATTYALKMTLLYTFLTPTGHIDDTDNTHSNDQEAPQPQRQPQAVEKKVKPLEEGTPMWDKLVAGIKEKKVSSIKDIKVPYSEELGKKIQALIDKQKPKLVKDSNEWDKAMDYIKEGKLKNIDQLLSKFQITKVLQKAIQKEIDDKLNQDALDEQLAQEQAQEAKDANDGRLPNLDGDSYEAALQADKEEIIKIMNTHRMSQEQRDALTAKLK